MPMALARADKKETAYANDTRAEPDWNTVPTEAPIRDKAGPTLNKLPTLPNSTAHDPKNYKR